MLCTVEAVITAAIPREENLQVNLGPKEWKSALQHFEIKCRNMIEE